MDQVLQAISTVGFPIAAYVGLFYLVDKRIKALTIEIHDLGEIIKNKEDKK